MNDLELQVFRQCFGQYLVFLLRKGGFIVIHISHMDGHLGEVTLGAESILHFCDDIDNVERFSFMVQWLCCGDNSLEEKRQKLKNKTKPAIQWDTF